ncbi:hypothetical protein GY45DRAFT_1315333 [Cubamyces sp. BRFM 1775]|nr:hypothetical protein GY45DRAFT_1315333 [Cubamyces sp. BRFM 1775]
MGLLGVFTILLPAFLPTRTTRGALDPEKAAGSDDDVGRPRSATLQQPAQEHLARGAGARGISGADTPRRPLHRVYQKFAHPLSRPIRSGAASEDLTVSGVSLYTRIKSYVWPTDDDSNDVDKLAPNYRWTPILSGIVIPFSILLEIPGLTEDWYIRTQNHQTVEKRKNPVILEVGMVISIICALIANVSLVLRFLEKRVKTVTLLCIVSLTVHDIINIITVTIFGVEHRFDDGFTYGEAFWMTLCSTIASTISNISLIVDLVRTPDFARRGSGLTRKQRSLMIVVIVLLVYIAFGALINSILLHLTFINGLYFSVVSIETIGFGDIVPKSTGARVWTCVYILFGVINIGVVIAMCRETILEGLEVGYRRRMRDMRQRRREARRFRRWEARWQRAVEFRLREAGLPVWVSDKEEQEDGMVVRTRRHLIPDVARRMPFMKRLGLTIKRSATLTSIESRVTGHHRMHLNVNALTNAQLEEAALEAGVPLDMFLDLGERAKQRRSHQHGTGSPPKSADDHGGIAPALSRAHAAHAFRDNIVSGWPSHPQTPTHAQVGRMAAMVTKFAVAIAGRHAHAPGLLPDVVDEERGHAEDNGATGPEGGEPPSREAGNTASSSDGQVDAAPEADVAERRPSFTDVKNHPATKWLKDFSRGASQRSAWTYENVVSDMEAEEKKAYYVKLAIAWILFFMFWTVGSGIFSATEGWPYGSAMYFCFLAFVTTGYGDFAPVTPAGRSIFVVWALFGVGTLTIVVSVLQEASSSRYKSALHSRVFDKAVKKYRKRQLQEPKQRPRPVLGQQQGHQRPSADAETSHNAQEDSTSDHTALGTRNPSDTGNPRPTAERYKESQEIAQRALEALPGEIVRGARLFQEYMQYFVSGSAEGSNPLEDGDGEDANGVPKVPPDMKKLLDELAEMEHINERVKIEILEDEDARKTLFMLSLERSLKKMVTSAEKALSALADRDALASIAAAQRSPVTQTPSGGEAHADSPGEGDSGQSTALPRMQSEPTRPVHLHHRRVQHAASPKRDRRGIEELSSSDFEDTSSATSSMTPGPS